MNAEQRRFARYNTVAQLKTPAMKEILLFTAGPVQVRSAVLEQMRRPMITHRSVEYRHLHASIVERMARLLDTEETILLLVSSATGAMEAGVRSAVSRKIMHFTCGAFGERWAAISRSNGKEAVELKTPWGKGIRCEAIEGRIDADAEAVALTHNETSTGVMNPLQDLADAVHSQSDALLFVDAVTSAFANDLKLRKVEADLVVFGTQKALALPPGLAFAVVSDRLLKKAEGVGNRGKYLDLLEIKEFADRSLVPTTPPVSLMYALDYQLELIEREGIGNRAERHRRMADMCRGWALKHGGLFSEEGFRSNTVTCILNSNGIPFEDIQRGLKSNGYEISEGYGQIREKTFRIGHMGDVTEAELQGLLKALDGVI